MPKVVTITNETTRAMYGGELGAALYEQLIGEFNELRAQTMRSMQEFNIDARIRGRALDHFQVEVDRITSELQNLTGRAERLRYGASRLPDEHGLVHEGPRTYEWKPTDAAGISSSPLPPSAMPYRVSPFRKMRERIERRWLRNVVTYSTVLVIFPTIAAAVLGGRFLWMLLPLQVLSILPLVVEVRLSRREANRWRERALTAERHQE